MEDRMSEFMCECCSIAVLSRIARGKCLGHLDRRSNPNGEVGYTLNLEAIIGEVGVDVEI